MKKLINWIKSLITRYKVTETYYIDSAYINTESVKSFIAYRAKHLKRIKCKCEIIYVTNAHFGKDVVGKVEVVHYKYNVKQKAKLMLKNGLIYWKFV